MFYSQAILARKGPLGKIWLAAHFERRLSKAQIFATDITQSIDTVLNPAQPLALRVSGHLMLGIIRIYSKKMKYLMVDCTEAMWKMKLVGGIGLQQQNYSHALHKVDMDQQHLPAIDDNKNYGHLHAEDADGMMSMTMMMMGQTLSLADMGFASQMLPMLSISKYGFVDEESVLTEMSELSRGTQQIIPRSSLLNRPDGYYPSPMGQDKSGMDVEQLRGVTPRTSMSLGRSPLSVEGRRVSGMSLTKFDEELPGFADDMFTEQLPTTQGFVPFEPPILEGDENDELGNVEQPSPTSPHMLMDEDEPQRRKLARVSPKPKRHVMVDERVEINARIIHQRTSNPQFGLRNNWLEIADVRAESDVLMLTRSSEYIRGNLCDELVELYDMGIALCEFPFPSKHPAQQTVTESPVQEALPEELRGTSRGRDSTAQRNGRISLLHQPSPSSHQQTTPEVMQFPDQPTPDFDIPPPDLMPRMGPRPLIETIVMSSTSTLDQGEKTRKQQHGNRRSRDVLALLNSELSTKASLGTEELFGKCSKTGVARSFIELLQLKSWGLIQLTQSQPFSDIDIQLVQ